MSIWGDVALLLNDSSGARSCLSLQLPEGFLVAKFLRLLLLCNFELLLLSILSLGLLLCSLRRLAVDLLANLSLALCLVVLLLFQSRSSLGGSQLLLSPSLLSLSGCIESPLLLLLLSALLSRSGSPLLALLPLQLLDLDPQRSLLLVEMLDILELLNGSIVFTYINELLRASQVLPLGFSGLDDMLDIFEPL